MAIDEPLNPGTESIYREIRRAILRLKFAPGSELEEGILSRQFGVSRTPVREALIRLSSEGLVRMQRGRGARVATLDLGNLRDFLEGLDLLQRAVTRLAAIRRTQSDLEAIEFHLIAFEGECGCLDNSGVNEANYAFHWAVCEAAHSVHLSAAYARVLAEGLRVAHLCFSEHQNAHRSLPAHLAQTMDDHRTMFEAIRSRDADAAERIAGEHVLLFKNRVADTLMSSELTRGISTSART